MILTNQSRNASITCHFEAVGWHGMEKRGAGRPAAVHSFSRKETGSERSVSEMRRQNCSKISPPTMAVMSAFSSRGSSWR
jgi:hypothetical protein